MKTFTIILGICCTLMACSTSEQVRSASTSATEQSKSKNSEESFPTDWIGTWQGNLNIFKDNQLAQSVQMKLEIAAMDTSDNHVWAITYGTEEASGTRAYQLETVDAEKGYYRIDEQNTILLDSYLFGDQFLCWYEVMGNQMMVRYEKKGDQLHFELIFGSAEPVSVTGNQSFAGEDIPAVRTFPISTYQNAVLKRQ